MVKRCNGLPEQTSEIGNTETSLKECDEFGTDFVPVRDGQIRRGHAASVGRNNVRAYRLLLSGNVVLKWQN